MSYIAYVSPRTAARIRSLDQGLKSLDRGSESLDQGLKSLDRGVESLSRTTADAALRDLVADIDRLAAAGQVKAADAESWKRLLRQDRHRFSLAESPTMATRFIRDRVAFARANVPAGTHPNPAARLSVAGVEPPARGELDPERVRQVRIEFWKNVGLTS